jgi:hypothetical protein
MKPLESERRPCPMDERERFIKLYEVILDIFKSYTANFVWTVGLLSLAAGWFISSESSRGFIHRSLLAFLGAVVVVIIVGLIHTVASWWYFQRSQETIAEMANTYDDLQPLPFRHYEIRPSVLIGNLLVSWTVTVGLIAFLVAARMS